MKYALIQDFKIENIVEIETEEQFQDYARKYQAVYDITNLLSVPPIGTIYDGKELVFPVSRKITKLGLRNRMTFPELITITTAAKTNTAVQVLMENLSVATFVDLNRPDTVGAFNLLVQSGLLTAERAEVIRTAPISDQEKFNE